MEFYDMLKSPLARVTHLEICTTLYIFGTDLVSINDTVSVNN